MNYQELKESKNYKVFLSDAVNSIFNKVNGMTITWGKTLEEDPDYSPAGPFLADIEISTICHGIKEIGPCEFCYKSNTPNGKNMSFETFKKVFNMLPKNTLQQIAFGIGDIDSHPQLFDILQYTRDNGIIPNITINGDRLTDEHINKFSNVLGAVAISNYSTDLCLDSVKRFSDNRGSTLKQINIHALLSEETYDKCLELYKLYKTDIRLKDLNAIVFLLLKNKGKRNTYTSITPKHYKHIINYGIDNNIPIGFDSCQCNKFLNEVKDKYKMIAEPCESLLFSIYISVDAKVFPCSFCDGEKEWEDGMNLFQYDNFLDMWNNDRVMNWRKRLLKNNRNCTVFKI